jgi:hypothetical protein
MYDIKNHGTLIATVQRIDGSERVGYLYRCDDGAHRIATFTMRMECTVIGVAVRSADRSHWACGSLRWKEVSSRSFEVRPL